MDLPADSHVHSEWSWDTGGPHSRAAGTMEATCRQAVRIGLPALFFTEHLDLEDAWRTDPEDLMPSQRHLVDETGHVVVPQLDVEGYLASVERCRGLFPELREQRARELLDLGSSAGRRPEDLWTR